MPDAIVRFLVCGVIFAAIDAIWLSQVANRFYKSQIGDLLLERPNFTAAVLFYIVFLIGVVVFALTPALNEGSLGKAVVLGAFFGLVTYATYDLTNLATLKGWTTTLVIVDMAWGAILTSSVTTIAYLILKLSTRRCA